MAKMLDIVTKGKGARAIASTMAGVKDPVILNLIEYLADRSITLKPIQQSPEGFEFPATINGQACVIAILGPAAKECYKKIVA